MNEIIQIKCPFCGAVLSVRNQAGIETKNVTCPICSHKNPFSSFRKTAASPQASETHTEYPGMAGRHEEYTATEMPAMNNSIGRLMASGSGQTYQLKAGRNIIGRKWAKSTADFPIETGDDHTMSREHLVVEVRYVAGKGMMHYASLFKHQINPTFIGELQLEFGDKVILNNGDTLRLPGTTLRFEIPDEDATQINQA